MKTIAELNKERLLCRKENPVRATVLTLLIDGATKLAKNENRQVEEKDLYKTAQSSVKEIEKDIQLLTENNKLDDDLTIELLIWKEFLPKLLTRGEIKRILLQKFSVEELVSENRGKIMKEMKLVPNIDMSLLSEIVKEFT